MSESGTLHALRNNAAGKITGFEVLLKSLDHEYLADDKRVRGYNVIIHSPEDFPDVSSNFVVHTDAQKVTRITVLAAVTLGDSSLLRLSEEVRGCYFIHEYDVATDTPSFVGNDESNCYSRCRLSAIYSHCNCTPYFFPPIKAGLPQCGIQHVQCLKDINVLQRNSMAPSGEPGFPDWSLPVYMNCHCKTPCSFTTYTTEIRHTFARQYSFRDFFQTSDYQVYFEVQYKDLYAISYLRFLKLDVRDLMVSFGGVASLFLGCSLISVAEVLYFVARSIKRLVKYRNRKLDPETVPAPEPEDTDVEAGMTPAKAKPRQFKLNILRWRLDKKSLFEELLDKCKPDPKPLSAVSVKPEKNKFHPFPYYP
ncbi:pickpocket protein 11 [Bemisia tabaci]|uniref:pickpocket protein 11 n=1 Tax=Bemisia tabaci TaxID=7038 RepID=UPI003B27D4CF